MLDSISFVCLFLSALNIEAVNTTTEIAGLFAVMLKKTAESRGAGTAVVHLNARPSDNLGRIKVSTN